MAEPSDNEQAASAPRRKSVTPEQRRFLATSRIREEQASEVLPEEAPSPPLGDRPASRETAEAKNVRTSGGREEHEPNESERRSRPGTPLLRPNQSASRVGEVQRAAIIIGALFLLFATFYVGKKFESFKYLVFGSNNEPKLDPAADKFPGVSSDELVAQALVAERAGRITEAVELFIAAKHKNLRYRGILFRVAKIGYDRGDFDNADKLFERAIAFGENVELADYFRGLIAIRHKDFPGAQRFFEASVNAAPFVADTYFYLAETIRMDHRPHEAIPHYEHARLLAVTERDEVVCGFKSRMARLEAADAPKVASEIQAREQSAPLSVDWLMTAAALQIREARVDEAIPLITKARALNQPGLFAACASDSFFVEAAKKQPQLADACRVETRAAP